MKKKILEGIIIFTILISIILEIYYTLRIYLMIIKNLIAIYPEKEYKINYIFNNTYITYYAQFDYIAQNLSNKDKVKKISTYKEYRYFCICDKKGQEINISDIKIYIDSPNCDLPEHYNKKL